jgi:hypothetical protein
MATNAEILKKYGFSEEQVNQFKEVNVNHYETTDCMDFESAKNMLEFLLGQEVVKVMRAGEFHDIIVQMKNHDWFDYKGRKILVDKRNL